MQRVVITGGTGLIGRPLAQHLAAAGYDVVVLSRNPAQATGLDATAGVQVVSWDARTAQGWGQLVDGAFAVINLAGAPIADSRWTPERKREIVESRKRAAAAVTEAVQQATKKPEVLVQASAVGYYGPRGDELITEKAAPGSSFDATTCAEWEASSDAVEALGVRRVILRTGIVLAGEGGALPRMALPFKLFVGGPIGGGKQYFPWIHLDDEVAAIKFLMENTAARGAFNLTAPAPVTNKEFSRALGKAMGRPSLMPVPAFALQVLFGEMAGVLLSGQRAVPKALQDLGYKFKFATADAALQDIY